MRYFESDDKTENVFSKCSKKNYRHVSSVPVNDDAGEQTHVNQVN